MLIFISACSRPSQFRRFLDCLLLTNSIFGKEQHFGKKLRNSSLCHAISFKKKFTFALWASKRLVETIRTSHRLRGFQRHQSVVIFVRFKLKVPSSQAFVLAPTIWPVLETFLSTIWVAHEACYAITPESKSCTLSNMLCCVHRKASS